MPPLQDPPARVRPSVPATNVKAAERTDIKVPERVLDELRALLQMDPAERMVTERVLELLPALVRLALVMDTVAWGVWKKKLAPAAGSPLQPGAPLQRVLREHARASEAPGDGAASAQIDRLRELTRAVVCGVAQSGGEVACRVLRGLSPAEIEAEVRPAGLMGRDAEYWRAYKARVSQVDGAGLERELTGVLGRFVDKWMRHLDANPRSS